MNVMIFTTIFFAVLLAFETQKNKTLKTGYLKDGCIYSSFSKIKYILSFVILSLLCSLCKSGTDMASYVTYYSSWTYSDLYSSSFEIGGKLLFIFLHSFIPNPYIGIGIIKVISIGLIYGALYLIRDRINIGLAILSYVILLYIFNFHLIRMMLAVGIVFVALAYEINGKSKHCFIALLMAVLFHYSSIIVVLVYIFFRFFRKNFSAWKIILIVLLLAVIFANIEKIVEVLTLEINVLQKYTTYLDTRAGIFGIVQMILFIPTLLILLQGYKDGKSDNFYKLSFFFGMMVFFAGNLGYIYKVISRTVYYFYFFFIAYGASTSLKANDIVLKCGSVRINLTTVLLLIYLAMQVYLYYFRGQAFTSNGLTRYVFIWNN